MTSNAVGGMSNNASGQIQESWSVPETMVDGITERLRKAIITRAIEACAGRDVTTFQNALIRLRGNGKDRSGWIQFASE
jgi:hypothetical protein